MKTRFSACWSPALGKALAQACQEPYTMSLVGADARACQTAVNQGIDSHLEACFCPDRGDSFNVFPCGPVSRLECRLSPESLPVLVRRLLESEDEAGENLASGICETLGIELV